VSALSIDPSAPAILYAGTYDATIYKSINGGLSWVAARTGQLVSQ
jgi:hypothetical protein